MCGPKAQYMLVFFGCLPVSFRSFGSLCVCAKRLQSQFSAATTSRAYGETVDPPPWRRDKHKQTYFRLKARLVGLFGKWLPKQLSSL